ncbi:MAG: GntR family transcriptional regulator [Verrucomicrobia bacterium]|nr:GntR family transcriptional regulator [Verrucomicrobiota bacterium]
MKDVNSDIAYDYIRKRILGGEYAPGASLATKTLSAEIGVSRTPVRDALRQLEADGLVTIQARLGASVKQMALKEFREMCGLRLALESFAAGLAATNRTEEDLREISLALEAMRKLTEKIIATARDKEEAVLEALRREDVRFHVAIMSAAKNELMKSEILRLHLINRVVTVPGPERDVQLEKKTIDARRRAVLASHEEIFVAIRQGDAAGARDAMAAHIQDIVDNTLRVLALQGGGVSGRALTEEELSYVP